MDKCKYDESNGLWHELKGDYDFPCLTLPERGNKPTGLWGSGTSVICRNTGRSSTRSC